MAREEAASRASSPLGKTAWMVTFIMGINAPFGLEFLEGVPFWGYYARKSPFLSWPARGKDLPYSGGLWYNI